MKSFKQLMDERCWPGYKPAPGKKAYAKGSCVREEREGGAGGADKAGGSGVVILRYADTLSITIGAGLTGTESAASGGYKRATITAGTGNVSWV